MPEFDFHGWAAGGGGTAPANVSMSIDRPNSGVIARETIRVEGKN